jgi:prepilin-type N-terminal cleavage/methylation domain-containing protein
VKGRCPSLFVSAASRRRGFSLVELLVVIALIGALVALLFPAVQAAREAARRSQCVSNLRQVAFAVLSHHDAKRRFPAGNFASRAGVCTGGQATGNDNPSQDHANWAILILPYLEEQSLFQQYDFSTYNEAPQNAKVREAQVGVYVCPSDHQTSTLTVPGLGPAAAWDLNVPYMPGSYRAVSGRSDGRRFLDDPLVTQYPRPWRGMMHVVGILGFGRERMKNVVDGASYTLMVGESVSRTKLEYRTLWAYSHSFFSLSATTPQARTRWGDYQRCREAGGVGFGLPCSRSWGSYHPGGICFALGDASVRFISDEIDDLVFAGAGSIAGREPERLDGDP